VRFATQPFSPTRTDASSDRLRHLTNYSLNRRSSAFVPNKSEATDGVGSKWSLGALRRHLDQHGPVPSSRLDEGIHEVVSYTLSAAQAKIAPLTRKYTRGAQAGSSTIRANA